MISRLETMLAAGSWLGLAGLLCCCAHSPRGYRLVAAPAPSYSVEGDAAFIRTDTFRLTVAPLDDMARSAFIHARAAGAKDPFDPGRGRQKYLSFRLSVENTSRDEPIVFQPQSIYLASEMGDRLLPLDFPQAYTRFAGVENSDPRFLEDLSKYLFDVGVSVPPGGRVEGLLVYPAASEGSKRLRMEFNFIQTGGATSKDYDVFFMKEPET